MTRHALVVSVGLACLTVTAAGVHTPGPQARPATARKGAQASKPAAALPAPPVPRARFLEYARASADWTWDHREEILARWRETFDPRSPFGYRAPGGLLDLASIYAFLF